MEPTNAERELRQPMDGTRSSSGSPSSPRSHPTSSSIADWSESYRIFSCECDGGCTECDYGDCWSLRQWTWEENRIRAKQAKQEKEQKRLPLFRSCKKDAILSETNEASKKTVAKFKNLSLTSEFSKDYCPYSSDNCGCSSGCTDCDYGLYTYTTQNKSKLKKLERPYVKSSSNFRPLKASEKSQKPAKSFNTMNVLRIKKMARFPKKKASKVSCYPETSGCCDCKSDCVKHDCKQHSTRNQMLKIKKKTLIRNLRKLKTRTARTQKLLGNKKVSENVATKVFEKDLMKNWFSDSSNSCDCNLDCTDCGKHNTQRKKLTNRKNKRTRTSTELRVSVVSPAVAKSVKNEKVSKQTTKIKPKRCRSWSPCENDSYFTPYSSEEELLL